MRTELSPPIFYTSNCLTHTYLDIIFAASFLEIHLLLSIFKAFTLAFTELTLIFVLILSLCSICYELTIVSTTGINRFGTKHN